MKKILLYGPPGSGKSTVARHLAQDLNLEMVDLDALVEDRTGLSVSEIMRQHGENAFRNLEAEALKEALSGPSQIIALGGGTLLRGESRKLAESAGDVLLLAASPDTLENRLRSDPKVRPLLAGDLSTGLPSLLEARREHYHSFRSRIETDKNDPAQVARMLQVSLGRFRVEGLDNGYDVLIESGGLNRLGAVLRERGVDGALLLVTDHNLGPLYSEQALGALRAAGYKADTISLPAGETAKSIETVSILWSGFLRAGLDRQSLVIALGGGVIGDLSGFAASTYMRGIRWVGVPSSLLAMVDSSLGGKTGFDLPEGKNLIGTFHAPRLVLADPSLLTTLPQSEFRSGLAEVVKHGIIADQELFELCSQGEEAVRAELSGILRRAMAVKIRIVGEDPYDHGIRETLNLGHTVGHALETASGYRLRHGEAVSIGMVAEARLAERLELAPRGLADRIKRVLSRLGLPTEMPSELSRESVLQSMHKDKKIAGGVIQFSLPVAIGKVVPRVGVADLRLIFEEARWMKS